MFCSRCGAKIDGDARFCGACGAPVTPQTAGPTADAVHPWKRKPLIIASIAVAALAVLAIGGFAAWSSFSAPLPIDADTFPDAALRTVVNTRYDTDRDGKLSRDEAQAVKEIEVEGAASLSGMGRVFTNAISVSCTGGKLSALDVSDMPGLERISAPEEPLASLDVSSNSKLASLDVSADTEVTGLDGTELHEVWVMDSVEQTFGSSGISSEYAVERDDAGRVLKLECTNGGGSLIGYEFTYDGQGNPSQVVESSSYYGQGDSSTSYDLSCDEQGRVISKIPTRSDATETSATYWEYDDDGRVIRCGGRKGDSDSSAWTYEYDDAGRLVREASIGQDGKERSVKTYRYEGDRCIGFRTDDATVSYAFDDAGRVTRVEVDCDDPALNATYRPVDYVYDDHGRLVSAKSEFTDKYGGAIFTASYTYDGNGNIARVDEGSDSWESTFVPSYTRYFVAEGGREPDDVLSTGRGKEPLVMAQHTALADVYGDVPGDRPNPAPYSMKGEALIMF